MVAGPHAYAITDWVLSGFIRVVTNPRALVEPYSLDNAMAFASAVRDRSHCIHLSPGPGHWSIFLDLCRKSNATGNLVPDAYLAALAIENGAELVTEDRDFARFPGLIWRRPLD